MSEVMWRLRWSIAESRRAEQGEGVLGAAECFEAHASTILSCILARNGNICFCLAVALACSFVFSVKWEACLITATVITVVSP